MANTTFQGPRSNGKMQVKSKYLLVARECKQQVTLIHGANQLLTSGATDANTIIVLEHQTVVS
jgi:hypothetical protein